MVVKKKQILLLSNGSLTKAKTFVKTSKKLRLLNKDHITFSFNKKNKEFSNDSENLKSFKFKYFK